ncbi:MAG: AAA family ATPase [Candidatus Acidiferrales bacterium]
MISFTELVSARLELQDFCQLHFRSVLAFRSDIGFKIQAGKVESPKKIHLTTSATCFESLEDCPQRFKQKHDNEKFDILSERKRFAEEALKLPQPQWESDESAHVYCRCRSLPYMLRVSDKIPPELDKHIAYILWQLEDDLNRFAIGEVKEASNRTDWYPPNAFHTYWCLELFDQLQTRFEDSGEDLRKKHDVIRRQQRMLLWAENTLGRQIALHTCGSPDLDTDQLAWALVIRVRFGEIPPSNLGAQDFVRQALHCLFETQLKIGIWPRYKPLFHYQRTGNAYCYVFETFAAFLKTVLSKEKEQERLFLIRELKRYSESLLRLWRYAQFTATLLGVDIGKQTQAWSSGHRTNDPHPEGWATASVFAFAQALRRLVGIWTRDEALNGLNALTTDPPEKATNLIEERGDTWGNTGGRTAAQELSNLFVGPLTSAASPRSLRAEPDDYVIRKDDSTGEDQARAAILFGPPGTSKSTLAKSVAGAIGWDYIELHASHFVANGLPEIQRTADDIFRKLMQLDHAVILFDEIDELVRERTIEPDAFGRFLTTSMLPKLAELWKQRKVVYFVATNHIEYFDQAIKRSERFDVVLLVNSPSYEKKVAELRRRLGKPDLVFEPTFEEIESELNSAGMHAPPSEHTELTSENALAKFVLLRWDQMAELAHHLTGRLGANERSISKGTLTSALAAMSDLRLKRKSTYYKYVRDRDYEQRDYNMRGAQ